MPVYNPALSMSNKHYQSNDPPRLREAFAAAQDLESFTRALGLLLAQGPLKHDQWELLDHVVRSMTRMRELLQHEPTRLVMEEDHDGIALLLPLLTDQRLEQLLDRLQRDRPQAQQESGSAWSTPERQGDQSGLSH